VTLQTSVIDGGFLWRQKPNEIELLVQQARAFYEQGQYDQSLIASDRAAQSLATRSVVLSSELGRYPD
jgi:hypothetical protein